MLKITMSYAIVFSLGFLFISKLYSEEPDIIDLISLEKCSMMDSSKNLMSHCSFDYFKKSTNQKSEFINPDIVPFKIGIDIQTKGECSLKDDRELYLIIELDTGDRTYFNFSRDKFLDFSKENKEYIQAISMEISDDYIFKSKSFHDNCNMSIRISYNEIDASNKKRADEILSKINKIIKDKKYQKNLLVELVKYGHLIKKMKPLIEDSINERNENKEYKLSNLTLIPSEIIKKASELDNFNESEKLSLSNFHDFLEDLKLKKEEYKDKSLTDLFSNDEIHLFISLHDQISIFDTDKKMLEIELSNYEKDLITATDKLICFYNSTKCPLEKIKMKLNRILTKKTDTILESIKIKMNSN